MTVAHHGESAVMSVFEVSSVPETGIEPTSNTQAAIQLNFNASKGLSAF